MNSIKIIKSLSLKNDFSPLLKLAIPLIITTVVQSGVTFLGNTFLAHLSEQAFAAGALVSWLFFTLINLLLGTFNAVNILVAHKFGENDHRGISLVLRDGFLLAMLLIIPTFLLLWNISFICSLLGQKPELIALATLYLHALAWGLLPKFILMVLFEFLIGLGHTRVSMSFNLASIPLYIFFSYALIFGKLGFPELGIAGAGWGMTVSDWIAATILCLYINYSQSYRAYVKSIFTWSAPFYLWEIIKLGLPIGLMFTIEVGFFFAVTLFMAVISIASLAANQIVMQYLGLLIDIILSLAQAMTVRMGHHLGANQPKIAERTSYAGIILSTIIMIIIAFFYWFSSDALISVDFNLYDPRNAETIYLAKKFLFIAAFFQILEAIRIALFGSLRGLKDTRFSLFTSIISFWCVALPIGCLLAFWFKIGGSGFWVGMVIGTICSVPLLYGRFKRKMRAYA
ncbi:MAG: MATE family efflux transporter [Gammaproteobacteria bacterium]